MNGGAVLFVQLRMIDGRRNADLASQEALNFQSVLDRRRINDSGTVEAVVAAEERGKDLEFVGFLVGFARFVDQIGTIESANDRLDLLEPELMQDVLADRRRGRCCQGKHR